MMTFLRLVAKRVSYGVIVIIMLAALLVCLSPLLSPLLNKKRTLFEKWASDFIMMPVSIQEIDFSWYRYYPEIRLNNVTLYNKATKQPALQIQSISLFFSIPQSLWQHQLISTGIMVTGTQVKIKKTETGGILLEGFPPLQNTAQTGSSFTDVAALIVSQPYLILHDINLQYDEFKGRSFKTKLNYLNIENSSTHHRLSGSGILYQKIPTEVSGSIEWWGQNLNLSAIKAKGYLYVTGLSLPQWIQDKSFKGWQVKDGIASAKIWGAFSHGRFRKLQGFMRLYDLNLYSQTNKKTYKINRLSGDVGLKSSKNQYILAGEDILIDLPNRLWPVTNFYLSFARGVNDELSPQTINLDYINLDDVNTFLFASPKFLPDSIQELFSALKLKGSLQNTTIKFEGPFSDWDHISLNTHFNQLAFSSWKNFPSVKNLTGTLKWDGKFGEMTLNSSRLLFEYDALFANPLNMEQLNGAIKFQKTPDHTWTLRTSSLQLLNSDVLVNLNGSLAIPSSGSMIADIKADFVLQKVNHISQYLPLRILSPNLVNWLRDAFLSGEIKNGHLELRGSLNEFPFDHDNGVFLVSGKINNIDLRYAPDWPTIKANSGMITFLRHQVIIDIDHAETQNISIDRVQAEIPNLDAEKGSILTVKGDGIQTDFNNGLKFIHISPLEKTIGKMFQKAEGRGPIALDLGLNIPLSEPDKMKVKGKLDLKEASLKLVPWNFSLDNLNGRILFTESSTEANLMQGILFNKPITISLHTINQSKDSSIVRASFQQHLNMDDLENWLKIPLTSTISGSAWVMGDMDFALGAPIQLHLRSNLEGLKINLPFAYGKAPNVRRSLSADFVLNEKTPWQIKVNYGDLLNAGLLVERKDETYQLLGAHLHLGAGTANLPKDAGLYITGNFEKLEWDQIKKYLSQRENAAFSTLPFRSLDINLEAFNLFGQALKQVHLQAKADKNTWMVNIDSPDIVGQVNIPKKITRSSMLSAQFQKLHIVSASETLKNVIDLTSIPSITLIANDVKVNDLALSRVTLSTLSSGNHITIQSFSMLSPQIDFKATGNWEAKTASTQTHLKGSARSEHVSQLLKSLGVDVHNFVSSKGKLDFNLSWDDAPYAPVLQGLKGEASIDLGSGRIVNTGESSVKMGVGRMLSIFSLQSIPRRLTLNFSDLYQKGYSFDSVRGDFTFAEGNAYTKNLRFDGPLASVGINGRIGLKNKDYNFVLSTKAYVTSGLPLAATLLTGFNPLVGLGAFAINSVIGSEMTTYYYSVTGSWNKPVWQSVNGPG